MDIRAGTTSYSMIVQLFNNTTGAPETGLTFDSTGINISYARAGAARVAIEEITLATAATAYASGGFVEIDATNMPGAYRLDVPNAALLVAADSVTVYFIITGVRSKAVTIGLSMVGTDSAALASVCTEARIGELTSTNIPADIDSVLEDTGTTLSNAIAAIPTSGGIPSLDD